MTLIIRIDAPGETTLEMFRWFLDQINNGDIIDNVTISGATLHDVTLHSEQGEDFLPAWTFTEIKYDLNNDGKRNNT
jgi:hypothetical protein